MQVAEFGRLIEIGTIRRKIVPKVET